ncbi:hypothetical protein BGZ58_004055, partial [Dissophora ornata]
MTDNLLTLNCLVEGDPISKVFALTASSTETVGQLRSSIHRSKPVWFKDLEAEDLTLWRVSIPDTDDDDDDEAPILLNIVLTKDKKKLKATRELSEFYTATPPKKTIHIIVQRPMP